MTVLNTVPLTISNESAQILKQLSESTGQSYDDVLRSAMEHAGIERSERPHAANTQTYSGGYEVQITVAEEEMVDDLLRRSRSCRKVAVISDGGDDWLALYRTANASKPYAHIPLPVAMDVITRFLEYLPD